MFWSLRMRYYLCMNPENWIMTYTCTTPLPPLSIGWEQFVFLSTLERICVWNSLPRVLPTHWFEFGDSICYSCKVMWAFSDKAQHIWNTNDTDQVSLDIKHCKGAGYVDFRQWVQSRSQGLYVLEGKMLCAYVPSAGTSVLSQHLPVPGESGMIC